MKSYKLLLTCCLVFSNVFLFSQDFLPFEKLDNRIDNQGYWRKAAEKGLTAPNPNVSVAPAIFTGSDIKALSVITDDSPDVVLITGNTSQSENSVFINPNDSDNPLNSNNSTTQPGVSTHLYGANWLYSADAGQTWDGSVQGAGMSNSGDPAALIGRNGRSYVGYINNSYGQTIAYSDDEGQSWTTSLVASASSGGILDKNHMWIDNSLSSPYEGNIYNAWTAFGGSNNNNIEISRSTNHGVTWSSVINVSSACNPGRHAQGVNIQTGPNGEVYAIFTIYDSWPADEKAIGMARSFDGGQTYTSWRIIDNIKGIRTSGTSKSMRVNSFPVMAVDISSGPHSGNIYVVWTNKGVPGVNTGNDIDNYMIRSQDQGETWSEPVKINQDPSGSGKQHYFPWITSDPATGTLSVIFYDDRNVASNQCEVYCANSFDGGETWEDFKVSDVSFTPAPIPGLASGYFGDYLGIAARNGQVYPVWTDNRTGTALTYTSPYRTSTMTPPTDLQAQLNEETGAVILTWQHSSSPTFSYYKIYRNFQLLGTSTWPFYSDLLPNYGTYRYVVTAYYEIEGESGPAILDVQWGNAQAQLDPEVVEVFVFPEGTAEAVLDFSNVGQLPLVYSAFFSSQDNSDSGNRDYCFASGGCTEFIARVKFAEVDNISECNGYEDFTMLGTTVAAGESFNLTVYNSTPNYPADVCGIWIDWNQNENFLDDAPVTVSGSPGSGPYTAVITVPEGAKSGDARMRIRIKRDGTVSPCGVTTNGEVEDYTVHVIGWVSASPMAGTIEPGESQEVVFNMNAAELELGTYQANFNISTNDPDNEQIVLPVIMHITDFAIGVTSDADSLCAGNSTVLHAVASGGSGNFTYSWTSEPAGFSSSVPDPEVTTETTTTYFVEITDGFLTLNDEITVVVVDLPVINLGPDIAVCEGGSAILEAGSGFATYLWSNGQTGQSIEVTIPGVYWVEVSNDFGCSSRDTLEFIFNLLPMVDLGDDMSFCEGSQAMITAGSGFSSYLWNTGESGPSITVSEPGEYWVIVTNQYDCIGQDTILLTMDPLPQAPEVTSGPVSVDNFLSPASEFTSTAGSFATTYEWKLEPAEAGIISGSGTSAQVTWMAGFTGVAHISVRSLNDCGVSAYSQAFTVEVFSTQGMNHPDAVTAVRVYPNPNRGTFNLQFNSAKDQEVRIRLTTNTGHQIMDNKEDVISGLFQKTFNLSNLPGGTYNLLISDKDGRLISRQQVVVQ